MSKLKSSSIGQVAYAVDKCNEFCMKCCEHFWKGCVNFNDRCPTQKVIYWVCSAKGTYDKAAAKKRVDRLGKKVPITYELGHKIGDIPLPDPVPSCMPGRR